MYSVLIVLKSGEAHREILRPPMQVLHLSNQVLSAGSLVDLTPTVAWGSAVAPPSVAGVAAISPDRTPPRVGEVLNSLTWRSFVLWLTWSWWMRNMTSKNFKKKKKTTHLNPGCAVAKFDSPSRALRLRPGRTHLRRGCSVVLGSHWCPRSTQVPPARGVHQTAVGD